MKDALKCLEFEIIIDNLVYSKKNLIHNDTPELDKIPIGFHGDVKISEGKHSSSYHGGFINTEYILKYGNEIKEFMFLSYKETKDPYWKGLGEIYRVNWKNYVILNHLRNK